MSFNKSIFVSGGTSGLGLKLVEHFLSNGFTVGFCARDSVSVENTIQKLLKKFGSDCQLFGFVTDVSSTESVLNLTKQLDSKKISIDVLICNAGVIGPIEKFDKVNLDSWKEAFEINIYGTANLVHAFLPSMLERGVGQVIHVSGGGATSPVSGMSSYAASKIASVRLIETLALEFVGSGVSFNSISPGMLNTRLLSQMLQAGEERIGASLHAKSLSRLESREDSFTKPIALIDFLTSEEGKEISGKLISAEWDDWNQWLEHLDELKQSDVYTLRRITGRDRGNTWGDVS